MTTLHLWPRAPEGATPSSPSTNQTNQMAPLPDKNTQRPSTPVTVCDIRSDSSRITTPALLLRETLSAQKHPLQTRKKNYD